MYKILALEFIRAVRVLQMLETSFAEINPNDEIDPKDSAKARDELLKLMGHTIALQAKTTAKTVRDVHNGLESVIVVKKFTQGLEEIRNNLRRELEDRYLYSIDASYARYLETSDPPFGDTDLSKFGGAAGEIAEAARCLALRRNKAVVFHLMLAMEEAIRALGVAKKATTHTADGRWLTWLVIANNIDGQVIKPMAAGPDKVAWENANAMLKSVGHAWRNPTDHPGSSYSEEDAETIFQAVKGFMRALAPLI